MEENNAKQLYLVYIYIYIYINLPSCRWIIIPWGLFFTTMKPLICKWHIPSMKKSKTMNIKPTAIFWTRYEMTEDYCIWKHKNVSPRVHQWPFYHLKVHKRSFPMVSKLVLGYLIPGLTQISSNSLIVLIFYDGVWSCQNETGVKWLIKDSKDLVKWLISDSKDFRDHKYFCFTL